VAGSKCTISTAGPQLIELESKCTNPTTGKAGRRSQCEPLGQLIKGKFEQGLNAVRIHRELRQERAFEGSYEAVKRCVARLKEVTPKPVWRLESQPGEEMQVDFASCPLVAESSGKRLPSTRAKSSAEWVTCVTALLSDRFVAHRSPSAE
jgi:hypothetical protein